MAAEAAGELVSAHVCGNAHERAGYAYADEFLPTRYTDAAYVKRMEHRLANPSAVGGQL